MEHFIAEGIWWLPGAPAENIPGTLTFDSNGISLVTQGSLGLLAKATSTDGLTSIEAPEECSIPVIHGRSREQKLITLFECTGYEISLDDATNVYTVATSITGYHATTDSFFEVTCKFDCVDAWAQPPSISEHHGDKLTVQWDKFHLASARVDSYAIRLTTGVVGRAGSEAVHLDRWTGFSISGPSLPIRSIVRLLIRPLQDLLVFALGRSVRLTYLSVHHSESGPLEPCIVSFDALQPAPEPESPAVSILSYTSPTLLTFRDSPLPFNELLPRWFELRTELSTVFVQLLSPFYAPFIFNEHRYSASFQSAEALARKRHGGSELSKQAHRERLKSIIDILRKAELHSEELNRVERLLTRNDKPLATSIAELVKSVGAIGEKIEIELPNFNKVVTGARTGISHPRKRGENEPNLYWYGEILRWVVRARLLMELGVSREEVEKRVLNRVAFTDALRRIQTGATGL